MIFVEIQVHVLLEAAEQRNENDGYGNITLLRSFTVEGNNFSTNMGVAPRLRNQDDPSENGSLTDGETTPFFRRGDIAQLPYG